MHEAGIFLGSWHYRVLLTLSDPRGVVVTQPIHEAGILGNCRYSVLLSPDPIRPHEAGNFEVQVLSSSPMQSDLVQCGNYSYRSNVCCQTCENDIFKTNEPIEMQISTSGPGGSGMKRSTL